MKNNKIDLNKELEIITFKSSEEYRNCRAYASECVVWEESGFIFMDWEVCLIDKKDKNAKKIMKNIIKRVREGWTVD